MPRIGWDTVGERRYETGVDRGVLYSPFTLITDFYDADPDDGPEEFTEVHLPKGYPWNGLVSVEVHQNAGPAEAIYFDGKKIMDVVYPGDFSATIKAITYPDEFLKFDGYTEHSPGMFVDTQPRYLFGLSYRSLEGNDIEDAGSHYKVHIMYNLIAVPDAVPYQTIDTNVEPIEFSWTVTGTPEDFPYHRPTAHIILDSRKINPVSLSIIENILYGDDGGDA